MLQSGKDIDIKNGISYFYFFTLFTAQNTNTRDKIEPTWPTSLSYITYLQQIRKDIGIKKGILYFYFFTLYTAQNTHISDSMEPTRQTSLSFITSW